MAKEMSSSTKRLRISIDVDPETRRRIRIAAAQRDVSVRQYILQAIHEHLEPDLEGKTFARLAESAFAEDWDSEEDKIYDRL